MQSTIVTCANELPDLSGEDELCLDVETTSFDDEEKALHPFNGHRVAGYGIATHDAAWYIPVRHRSPGSCNVDLDKAKTWLHKLAKRPRTWVGHNIKFDARFSYQDGVYLQGDLADTMVLARLVDPLRFNASLAVLAKEYCDALAQKESSRVTEYCAAAKSKDYGVVPIDIMALYCIGDLRATMALKSKLLEKLPKECDHIWSIERAATRTLLDSELHGVNIPREKLLRFAHNTLRAALEKQERLNELAGEHVDVNSNKDMTNLMARLCVTPREFTPTGQPSWSADTLRSYDLELCSLAADVKELSYSHSNFGDGWLRRLAADNTLHPNFKQYGTKTGRLACEDPNFQNLDLRAKAQVLPREGCQLVSIDASQIEFRLFAHYTNSPGIVGKYNNDPNTDYHQSMADMLGIPRKPAKTLNFGFIYGMGRAKLEAQLIGFIRSAVTDGDEKVTKALAKFNFGEVVTATNASIVASNIYNHVHRVLPEIRQFASRVERVVKERGFVRNVYRRCYYVPPELAHKARNYVVQGAAADLLKDWLAHIGPVLKSCDARLLANVHDELLLETPVGSLHDLVRTIVPVLENPHVALRVPVKVEVSACDPGASWADKKGYIAP